MCPICKKHHRQQFHLITFRKTLRLDNWFSVGKHKEPKESVIKLGKQNFVANSEEGIDAIHNAAKLLKTSKARHRSSSHFIINEHYRNDFKESPTEGKSACSSN